MPTFEALWATTDYRIFLRDWLESRKAARPAGSLRWMAQKLAMHPSLLSRILSQERHLSHSRVQPVCDLLGLPAAEAEYFRQLVHYAKSKGHREAQACFSRMAQLRRVSPVPLDDVQVAYWESWVHPALRSLLACRDFRDEWADMGAYLRPRQGARKVREAMGLLERIGLVRKDDDGIWRARDHFLRDGSPAQAPMVRHFHRQAMMLAIESIEGVPKERRNLSSLTVSIPPEGYPRLVEMIEEFRARVLATVAQMRDCDRVYQMNLQLLPLALPEADDAP
ncbi:MAG TPA: TIGR02147 family protein [Fibrobacteria bacterium]|nr:TIGR02147 family protein [Fibrobacteria bacterium]